MKTAICVACVLATLFVPLAARADFLNGVKLHELLSSDDPNDRLTARGYIMGAFDAVTGSLESMPVDLQLSFATCAPLDATLTQFELVVKKYLAENPERLHFGASILVAAAIAQAFPCGEALPGR